MQYFIPSSNGSRSRSGSPGSLPVNPSTTPGGRDFSPPPADWMTKGRQTGMPEIPKKQPPMSARAGDKTKPVEATVPPKGSYAPYTETPLPPDEFYPPDKALTQSQPRPQPMPTPRPTPDDYYLPPVDHPLPSVGAFAPDQGFAMTPLSSGTPDFPLSPLFSAGFLHSQLGRIVRVESGGSLPERIGRLRRVGADYLLLQSPEGHDVLCDLKSVKYVTIVPGNDRPV